MNSSHPIIVTKRRRLLLFNLIIIFLLMGCVISEYLDDSKYDPPVVGFALTPSVDDPTLTNYDGTYTLVLVFDTGCNEAYNGDYTSYSRVNRVYVSIFKKYVTLTYDRASASGDKHFVVEGSGNIDVNGDLTLDYKTTFTRKTTCNGTPCEGTESGSGTFKGNWNSDLGLWEGVGTGTVNVNYPNTLGTTADNSITCSASIIKSKITRGFNDPDL